MVTENVSGLQDTTNIPANPSEIPVELPLSSTIVGVAGIADDTHPPVDGDRAMAAIDPVLTAGEEDNFVGVL